MTSGRNWLHERLRSESVRDVKLERWNSIISRPRPLTLVDESTKVSGHGRCNSLKLEAAQGYRDQFVPLAGEQGKGRGRAKTNSLEPVIRGNVGALREIRPEQEIMNAGERRLMSLATAIIGDTARLSMAETKLVARPRG
jgi:hypothetical protein